MHDVDAETDFAWFNVRLLDRSTHLSDCNFFIGMLYKHCY